MRRFAVSAIGRDRPGIVAAVTARLLERGLNLEDSQMTILRGHFAMTLIVGGDDDIDTEALRADLDRVRGEEGLEATALAEVEEDAPVRAPVPSHLVSVYGADHPGIVHAVASALADARIDITDLNSHLVDADGGGGAIYAMLLEVALPPGVSGEALEALLEAVRREHGVEITVREAEQDEL
jgi:glycine cleavage system transcriptional repressor